MKDLPKIFVPNIEKDIINNQETIVANEQQDLNLDKILTKNTYAFNHIYQITEISGKITKSSIIKITEDKILTIDNEWIKIKDIKSIIEITDQQKK